jgi:hypothetical protein
VIRNPKWTEVDATRLAEQSRVAQVQLTPLLKTACMRVMRQTTEAADFRPHATASLFSIGGLHFLITAAHIFDGEPSLWVENEVTKKRLTLVGPRWSNEEIDIAFVQMRDELVAGLQGMRFLTMQDVQLQIPDGSGLIITGFPQELNVGTKYALGYRGALFTEHLPGVDYDPGMQLCLRYDTSFSAGEDGTPIGLPDSLKGMSGCPVWVFDRSKPLHLNTTQLVGVQTSTIPVEGQPNLKLVVATRWRGVLASLVGARPELERVLNLYGYAVDHAS